MGLKSPVTDPVLNIILTLITSRRQGRYREIRSEGSGRAGKRACETPKLCEPEFIPSFFRGIETSYKAKFLGKVAFLYPSRGYRTESGEACSTCGRCFGSALYGNIG